MKYFTMRLSSTYFNLTRLCTIDSWLWLGATLTTCASMFSSRGLSQFVRLGATSGCCSWQLECSNEAGSRSPQFIIATD